MSISVAGHVTRCFLLRSRCTQQNPAIYALRLKPDEVSRYEWLERLMWGKKDTRVLEVPRTILVLNKRPWHPWKRRYWLRAAIYFWEHAPDDRASG